MRKNFKINRKKDNNNNTDQWKKIYLFRNIIFFYIKNKLKIINQNIALNNIYPTISIPISNINPAVNSTIS